jgi:hypothetical protein
MVAAAGAGTTKTSLHSNRSERNGLVQKDWSTYHDNILRIYLENNQITYMR